MVVVKWLYIDLHGFCLNSQMLQSEEKRYDFFPSFEHMEPYISTADIAIANLETTIAGEDMGFSVSGDPLEDGTKSLSYFNAPVELLDALTLAGFNVLTTAIPRGAQSYRSAFGVHDIR